MAGKKRRRDSSRVDLESLEDRLLLAGDVTVAVDANNGNLTVTGNALGNVIVMTKLVNTVTVAPDAATRVNGGALGVPAVFVGVTGKIAVSMGDGDDNVTIGAVADTFLVGNGLLDPAEGMDTRDLLVDLGAGDDTLDIIGLRADDLTVHGRAGEDTIGIRDNGEETDGDDGDDGELNSPSKVFGKLTITDSDTADITLAGVNVAENATITLGNDGNTVLVSEGTEGTFGSWFGGNLTITGGSGDDVVTVRCDTADTVIEGDLTVKLYGAPERGDDLERDNFLNLSETTVGGSLLYVGGNGPDTVTVADDVDVARDATLNMFNGPNTLTLEDGAWFGVERDLLYRGGSGVDTLGSTDAEIDVYRNASFYLGNGDNTLQFASAANEVLWVARDLLINGGRGSDMVSLDSSDDLEVDRNATFNLGAGENTLEFLGNDESGNMFLFGGNLTYSGGAGDDTLTAEGPIAVAGNMTVNLGNGTNTVDMEWDVLDTDTDVLAVAGNLVINGGSGDDTITLGGGDGVSVVRNTTFNLGAGENTLDFTESGDHFWFSGDLTVTGGSGADTFTSVVDTELDGNATLRLGGGANGVSVNADWMDIGGNLTYTGGSGDDDLAFNETDVWIGGNARINVDGGDNTLTTFAAMPSFEVDGWFSYSGGTGIDTLDLRTLDVNGQTTINTGGGDDVVAIYNGSTLGALVLNTGAGDDQAFLGTDSLGWDDGWLMTQINGPVSVHMGSGDDDLSLGYEDTVTLNLLSESVVLNGGSGLNPLTIGDIFQAFTPVLLNWEQPT
jgi:hypothetical protein